MGATYWQLNDNWPVASWSSVDYFGRWKALHYFAKRMYDQILISCEEEDTRASIHLSNEHNFAIAGKVAWKLLSFSGEIIEQGERQAQVPAMTSARLFDLDFAPALRGDAKRERFLSFAFTDHRDQTVRHGATVFSPYKHLNLHDPKLKRAISERPQCYEIQVTASAFAKFVALDLTEDDAVFSDNYFDLEAWQTRVIHVPKGKLGLKALEKQLVARSLFESY
jgi:beta-mannosidase